LLFVHQHVSIGVANFIRANYKDDDDDMMIYLLTAVGLSPGGSSHLYANNTWNNTYNKRTIQITTNVEECGPWPVFASFT